MSLVWSLGLLGRTWQLVPKIPIICYYQIIAIMPLLLLGEGGIWQSWHKNSTRLIYKLAFKKQKWEKSFHGGQFSNSRGRCLFYFHSLGKLRVPTNRNLKLAGGSGVDSMHLINKWIVFLQCDHWTWSWSILLCFSYFEMTEFNDSV